MFLVHFFPAEKQEIWICFSFHSGFGKMQTGTRITNGHVPRVSRVENINIYLVGCFWNKLCFGSWHPPLLTFILDYLYKGHCCHDRFWHVVIYQNELEIIYWWNVYSGKRAIIRYSCCTALFLFQLEFPLFFLLCICMYSLWLILSLVSVD